MRNYNYALVEYHSGTFKKVNLDKCTRLGINAIIEGEITDVLITPCDAVIVEIQTYYI